eukprot:4236020-Amphidinium_carterae.1
MGGVTSSKLSTLDPRFGGEIIDRYLWDHKTLCFCCGFTRGIQLKHMTLWGPWGNKLLRWSSGSADNRSRSMAISRGMGAMYDWLVEGEAKPQHSKDDAVRAVAEAVQRSRFGLLCSVEARTYY